MSKHLPMCVGNKQRGGIKHWVGLTQSLPLQLVATRDMFEENRNNIFKQPLCVCLIHSHQT